jgi:hypothetical protein
VTEETLEAIARIAEHHRAREGGHPWNGLSIADLLKVTGYAKARPSITVARLAEWIERHPEVIRSWRMWSDDKRTSGGFSFERRPRGGWRIGSVDAGAKSVRGTPSSACAAYILKELDFWLSVGERPRKAR